MKTIISVLAVFCLVSAGSAQESLGKKVDELTYQWDGEASRLETYEGLSQFCIDEPYRREMIEILEGIHHYDSVLYSIIAKKAQYGGASSEMKKTLKDIEKLETEYSINDFLNFLREECVARNEIEKNARKTGEDKDAAVYILETELQKYVKHITKRIDIIREHVHHLNIK